MWEAMPTNLECHNRSTTFKWLTAHRQLLGNGVKFIPTPSTLKREVWDAAVDRFVNKTRWRAHFGDDAPIEPPSPLPPPPYASSFFQTTARPQIPSLYHATGTAGPRNDVQLEKAIREFQAHTHQLAVTRICNPLWHAPFRVDDCDTHLRHLNLTAKQREALAELRKLTRFSPRVDGGFDPPQLVICNADKNLGLTIVDFSWFNSECLRQLGDKRYYTLLEGDEGPRRIYAGFRHLRRLAFAGKYVGDPCVQVPEPQKLSPAQKYLLSCPPSDSNHRTPSFYVIPKVHKATLVGRPITPAHRYFLTPLCNFITKMLWPFVEAVPEILRDSTQLLLELEEPATLNLKPHDEVYLVTGDVESLYTNIPRKLCEQMLRTLPIPPLVFDMLFLLFEYCIVRYAELYFLQHDGFPMGANPAPNIANLFLWLLVRRIATPPQRRLYRRLIDDAFIVWVGTRESLDRYLDQINKLHPQIRITWNVSTRSVNFLDLEIYLGDRFRDGQGRLDVRVYQKELNRYLYIPPHSFHRQSQHRAWIKAELLRLLRNTSSASELRQVRELFYRRLRARGHRPRLLRRVFSSTYTLFANRDIILAKAQHSQDSAYHKSLILIDCMTNGQLVREWSRWCKRETTNQSRATATPWPAVENRLLNVSDGNVDGALANEQVTKLAPAAAHTIDSLHGLFTRDEPPPTFIVPLTSATAGLRWRDLDPKPNLNITRPYRKRIIVVLRRPPSLCTLLRFSNPRHRASEVHGDGFALAPSVSATPLSPSPSPAPQRRSTRR